MKPVTSDGAGCPTAEPRSKVARRQPPEASTTEKSVTEEDIAKLSSFVSTAAGADGASSAHQLEKTVEIWARLGDGEKVRLLAAPSDYILELKEQLEVETGIPPDEQRIIVNGSEVCDMCMVGDARKIVMVHSLSGAADPCAMCIQKFLPVQTTMQGTVCITI